MSYGDLPILIPPTALDFIPIRVIHDDMAWTTRDELRLMIRIGLTKGLKRVHGMRRQLTEDERDRIAEAILEQLELANYRIEPGPPVQGHGRRA